MNFKSLLNHPEVISVGVGSDIKIYKYALRILIKYMQALMCTTEKATLSKNILM